MIKYWKRSVFDKRGEERRGTKRKVQEGDKQRKGKVNRTVERGEEK